MERVFKPIFSLIISPPGQLDRTDWFNFQTKISGHFVTGDWNGQIKKNGGPFILKLFELAT